MPSLRIISLLATIACAAFSNAAPVTPPAGVTNIGTPDVGKTAGGVDLQSVNTNFPGVPADIVQGYLAAINVDDAAATLPTQDDQLKSIPEILKAMVDQLIPIAEEITDIVSVDIQMDDIVSLIGRIQTIVAGAVAQVQALAAGTSGGILTLAGSVLSIQQVAMMVVMSLYLIVNPLVAVITAVPASQLQVIMPLVGAVGGAVASLLAAVFSLVVGLLASVVPLVQGLLSSLSVLGFSVVITALGLTVSA